MSLLDERPHEAVGLVRLENPEEFVQAVLDDIEFVFRRYYGKKWTPEAQQVFQALCATCLEAARAADPASLPEKLRPLREAVILTNDLRRT